MPQTEPVSFRNGKISFATGEAFEDFLKKEFKKPYDAYQKDLRVIVPAGERARMNTEDQDDDMVKDLYFSGLLNAERELMIDGTNYRITSVGTFAFKEENRAKILKAISKIQANGGKLPGSASGRQSSSQMEEEFIPIEGGDGGWYPADPDVSTPPDDLDPVVSHAYASGNGCGATTNTKTVPFHGDFGAFFSDNILKGWNALKRGKDLKAVVWSENWGIYSSTGIKSVNQQKGWTGIWRRDDADFIMWMITQGEMEFKDPFGNTVLVDLVDSQAEQGVSIVHRVFDWNSAKFKVKFPLVYPTSLSKTYKINKLHSCHFVRDDGNLTSQVKLEIN